MVKKLLLWVGGVLVLVIVGLGAFVGYEVAAFNRSLTRKYDVPLPEVARSSDPAVLERGKHIAESFGGCLSCHGQDLGGGKAEDFGALATVVYPNITSGKGGRGASYSEAEFVRLLLHGVRRDGTAVRFMPAQEFAWWPVEDAVAVTSYVRTMPAVDREVGTVNFGVLLKVLDRLDMLPVDSARRIDHTHQPGAPAPAETKEYGAFLGSACRSCHGEQLSGGPIPGAPEGMAVPPNLTAHDTGLKDVTLDEFKSVLRTGVHKNGQKLDALMPIEMTRNYSDLELGALYAYLMSLPPLPLGSR